MDNLSFRIQGVVVDPTVLTTALIAMGINVTHKTIVKQGCELVLFSLPVGPYKCRWLFRVNLTDNTVGCSGGVTKTFFDHNVWVFKNEATQLAAIMGIVSEALVQITGIKLESADPATFLIERVELTNHFLLPETMTVKQAIEAIDVHFMTLLPKRYSQPEGKNHDNAGVVRLGKTKSSRVCRVYDPASKFLSKPAHIPADAWEELQAFCVNHLRVEVLFNKRDLVSAKLTTLEDWSEKNKVAALIALRYQRFGLSVEFKATNDHFKPSDIRDTNPSFVEFARHWFSAGAKGTVPNPGSGSATRFKQYMAQKGYRTEVPFARHHLLIHGLHAVLVPDQSAELPAALRNHPDIFRKWWIAL
jgi:hypothetical protein